MSCRPPALPCPIPRGKPGWCHAPDCHRAAKVRFVRGEKVPEPWCTNHCRQYQREVNQQGGAEVLLFRGVQSEGE